MIKKPFEPKDLRKPTKREIIRLALAQRCNNEINYALKWYDRYFLTFKLIVCVLLGWWAAEDRPRWIDLYGEKSPHRMDLFWEDPVVVAIYGVHQYNTMEYTAWEWWEIVVGWDGRDWRFDIQDADSA